MCRRPAVSTITTSAPRSRPRATASKATAPGSEPSGPLTTSHAGALAPRSSCSTAAARKVSAAPMTTVLPSVFLRCQASLPIVVVLPVPLTPTTRMTVGSGRMSIVSSPVRANWASSCASRSVSCLAADQPALLGLALELLDDLRGRAGADVGVDQRLLEALPGLLVEVALEQRRLDLGRSASRVLRMFERRRRKKPRRASPRSASARRPRRARPSMRKRSFQSRAMGAAG